VLPGILEGRAQLQATQTHTAHTTVLTLWYNPHLEPLVRHPAVWKPRAAVRPEGRPARDLSCRDTIHHDTGEPKWLRIFAGIVRIGLGVSYVFLLCGFGVVK
jgi:hypothetical protein